ncbi:MAG: BamA/TamA family outer membrane protein [Fimbriimonadaceae bacterium]|nr:BamA/TamA family outer membrane protein [Fimbriimonadaceae bacterium]QYK56350.1 MAG: BamA/TamA family outer membrane protein [Fimbriimonadaceae bacterium]
MIVRNVEIRGNERINANAITGIMKLKPGATITSSDILADEASVRSLGFFKDVKILSSVASDTEADLIVQVEEYPVAREVKVLGNTVVTTEAITQVVEKNQPLGQVWNNRNARPIRDDITKLYEDKGVFVQIDQLGPEQDSPGTVLVSLIEPRVNEITLTGLTRTNPKVIRRIMKTKPGGLLSAKTWRRDLEELYFTYWFESDGVKPSEPRPTDVPGEYDLAIEFKEARTGLLNAGVALDPQSRLVGTASYSDSNFMGRGQSVGLQLSQATTGGGPSVELGFGNRFYDSKDTSMNVSLFSRVVYNFTGSGVDPFGGGSADERFDERRTGASVSFTRPVGDYRASIGLRGQNARTLEVGSKTDEFIQQDGDLISLQMGVSYDVRQPTVEPYTGRLISMSLEPGYSNIRKIGGNVKDFTDILGTNMSVKTGIEYRQYWSRPVPKDTPFDQPRPVLAFRARYGRVFGNVPFFEQLFVGGADSLRGYPNQRFWGNQSFLSSLEYRQPIQKSFNLIGFVDYGGAWGGYGRIKDFDQSGTARLRYAYGIGVGFRIPRLSTIRIDFAFNQEGQNRTHFSFGTSF